MLNQQNTSCEYGVVFCDWLDVTFSEKNNSCSDFVDWFLNLGFDSNEVADDGRSYTLRCGIFRSVSEASGGVVKITLRRGVIRVSLSGVALEYLRLNDHLNETLFFFSEFPFFITRLDAALDVDVIGWKRIEHLRQKHPSHCSLSSRALSTTSILSQGLEGRSTGTFYVGHGSKAGPSARCYDKRHEIWKKSGVDIGFNVFRYEVTVRFKRDRRCASLADVQDPASLFYHYASPSLLRKPKGVTGWLDSREFVFTPPVVESVLPAQKIKRLLSESYIVGRIARLSLEDGSGGVEFAVNQFKKELEAQIEKSVVSSVEASIQ